MENAEIYYLAITIFVFYDFFLTQGLKAAIN